MKLKFKKQAFQSAAVDAVADCFAGQPFSSGLTYRVDPGRAEASSQMTMQAVEELAGFRNANNPNVFVIGTLKHSDNTISRRQEVGRGLRLAVNQAGNRKDDPATVHQVNVLTVVASESYQDFVSALQKDISESLSERPRVADETYFTGKVLIGHRVLNGPAQAAACSVRRAECERRSKSAGPGG